MKNNKDEKIADKALLRLQLFEQARAIPKASETAKNEKKPEKNSETFLTKNKKDAKPKRRKK